MAKKLVVDSSVIVKWVNSQDEKLILESNKVLEDAQNGKVILIAPELAKYEVGNVLWKKKMNTPQTQAALATVYASPVEFVSQNDGEAMETMRIAKGSGITFYDATFMSLAKSQEAVLVTDNPKHQKKFENIRVVALRDYK